MCTRSPTPSRDALRRVTLFALPARHSARRQPVGHGCYVTPYIDHIAAGVIDFVEGDFGKAEVQEQITAAGLAVPLGVATPMLSDPDHLRLQIVNATHGLFDTIMPGGRVTAEPAALIPIGLDHIMLSVADIDKSAAHYRKLSEPRRREVLDSVAKRGI